MASLSPRGGAPERAPAGPALHDRRAPPRRAARGAPSLGISLLERLVTALAALAVLGVAAVVGSLSLLPGPVRSGVSRGVVDASLETLRWLEVRRAQARAEHGVAGPRLTPPAPGVSSATAPAPPPRDEPRPGVDARRELAPPATWIPRVPGAAYAPVRRVPAVLRLRYQAFEAAWDLAQEGSGRFVATDRGEQAYEVTALDPESLLATHVGLQPGDRVVTVNGTPLGTSVAAGRALFEQLSGERRFVVVVERRGQPVVLSFEVDGE